MDKIEVNNFLYYAINEKKKLREIFSENKRKLSFPPHTNTYGLFNLIRIHDKFQHMEMRIEHFFLILCDENILEKVEKQ